MGNKQVRKIVPIGFYAPRVFLYTTRPQCPSVERMTRALLDGFRIFLLGATQTLSVKWFADEVTGRELPKCPYELMRTLIRQRISRILAIGFREGTSACGYVFDITAYLIHLDVKRQHGWAVAVVDRAERAAARERPQHPKKGTID